jgi:molecular chaperone GrpE (heat shock protein)
MFLGPELKVLTDQVADADARLERQRKRLQAKEKATTAQFEKLLLQSAADVTNLHKQYKIDMQGLMDKVKSHQADC